MGENEEHSVAKSIGSSAAVYRDLMNPEQWLWSAAGPWGMNFGAADTEQEAWEQARLCRESHEQHGEALRRARGSG